MSEVKSQIDSQVTEVNEGEENPNLNVELKQSDIATMVQIIDVCTQRGGFRAPELKGVGEFYEKLREHLPNEKN